MFNNLTTCKEFWSFDDFSSCARHDILEIKIPFTLVSISLVFIVYHLWNYSGEIQLDSKEDLLNENQQQQVQGYGAIEQPGLDAGENADILDKHFNIKYLTLTSDEDAKVSTKVVFRSNFERTMLFAQEVLIASQVLIASLPFFIPKLLKEWNYQITSPLTRLLFWSYILLLTTIRLVHSKNGLSSKFPNLWYHTFNTILVYLFVAFFLFRSAVLDKTVNTYSKVYYISEFVLLTILWLLQGCDHFSDRPISIYQCGDLTPSVEPQSTFFQIASFSWVEPMIMQAQKTLPTMKDIWSLKLEDNAYSTIKQFHEIQSTSSFSFKLFYQFRKLFFYQSVITSLEAVVLFFPSILLKQILQYVEAPDTHSSSVAWLFVILMTVCSPMNSTLSGRGLFLGRRICTRMRAILIGEIYSKGLRKRSSLDASKAESKDEEESDSPSADKKQNNNDSEGGRDLGSIINLIAVDSFKVSEICGYLHYFVNSFVMVIIAITILYGMMGVAALVGVATIVMILPINYKIMMKLGEYQKDMLKITDRRIQKLNECFQNIRIVKYFAWETKFAEEILQIREDELHMLLKRCYIWLGGGFIWFISPTIVCFSAFYYYVVVQKQPLTAPIAFTALSLFNLLRTPLDTLADMLSFTVQSKVSLKRIEDFLDEPETTKYTQLVQPRDETSPEIGFQNASFSWSVGSKADFKLRNLDIAFTKGKLNVIIGPTGSGKTSLLLALLGEMTLLDGKVFLPGFTPREDLVVDPRTGLTESVAYCSQTAWLLNGTIKENILFSSPFNEVRYKEVVEACGLKRDLEILAAGDKTEIGEKGITLSGGQKQRVSLARALYSNAAYVLLDDCLSAVDSHTSVHIYDNCINGPLMENRTCVLVSHNVALTIKDAAHVVIMENGRVKNQGKVDELVKKNAFDEETIASVTQSRNVSSVNLAKLNQPDSQAIVLDVAAATLESELNADMADAHPNEDSAKIDTSGKLIEEETKSDGFVKWRVYQSYISIFGTPFIWFALAAVIILGQLSSVYQSYWLRIWTIYEESKVGISSSSLSVVHSKLNFSFGSISSIMNSIDWNRPILKTKYNDFSVSEMSGLHSSMYYLGAYSLIGVLYSFFSSLRVLIVLSRGLTVSRRIFKMLLMKVLRAEVRFFDSTPIGRIMNRFSKDIEGVDQELGPYAELFIISLVVCLTIIIIITCITPAFLIVGTLISAAFSYVGVLYLTLSRELKRYESVTRSPINQHFTETLTGATTIRAYGDERRFLAQNMQKIDANNRPFFFVWVNNRWMSFRAQLIGSLFVAIASALVVAYAGSIDAGMAGISLSFAASFSTSSLWVLRCYADVEININAFERVQEYIDDVKQESAAEVPENDPPSSWPQTGEIEVRDLALRYASHLPLVIKNISFHVKSGEKVGVVGRTGAGKSTIITSLFRFIEPDQGSILIDGVDIGKIGLNSLRRGLAIIPQEPTLFSGTLRSNLDMFAESKDIDIYESLRRVGLISVTEFSLIKTALESGQSLETLFKQSEDSEENSNKFTDLEAEISENGGNLSQGERQLVCLARSLLKHPKILLLDEATASIDYETDTKIQQTIRDEFSSSTILTIAHRLKTIIDYDKILLLDHGEVKEFDHPYKLITDAKSQFRSMCEDTGEFEELVRLAKGAFDEKKK